MVFFPETFEELLKIASKELKMCASRIFTMDGAEVDNILLLRYFFTPIAGPNYGSRSV